MITSSIDKGSKYGMRHIEKHSQHSYDGPCLYFNGISIYKRITKKGQENTQKNIEHRTPKLLDVEFNQVQC